MALTSAMPEISIRMILRFPSHCVAMDTKVGDNIIRVSDGRKGRRSCSLHSASCLTFPERSAVKTLGLGLSRSMCHLCVCVCVCGCVGGCGVCVCEAHVRSTYTYVHYNDYVTSEQILVTEQHQRNSSKYRLYRVPTMNSAREDLKLSRI